MPLPAPAGKGRVQAEPLAVSPALLGRRLAGPGRRGAALLVDLAVLGALSTLSSWALALALLLLAALVHQALMADGARPAVARGVAAALVLLALAVAWAGARPAPRDDWQAAADQALGSAESVLAASAAGSAPATGREDELRRAVEQLEQLRRDHRPPSLVDRLDETVAELGRGFGWGIVYFSLLPALWPGRTVGKALLRLRIVELSGRPLTPLRALKRYGGYAAGLATGGLGFAQALWDPNRQCLHDKAAHTVVLDLRDGAKAP